MSENIKCFILSNGISLPAVGFGTYKATTGNGEEVILQALKCGYRYFDTASFYDNEVEIGNAIRESKIAREELFLSSKVWKTDLGYEKTMESFEESCKKLQTEYLDLYLIHWPKEDPSDLKWKEKVQESWKAMEELYEAGKIKAIGLSNFLPHHIMAIMQTAKVKPMVNQLELHVGYMQEAAVAYCKEHDIQVLAWSPLGRDRVMQNESVVRMAEKYQVSPAQLLLSFLLQNDIAVIPKASSAERMIQNQQIFDIHWTMEDFYFLRCLPQIGWSGEHPDFERVIL